ncbi:MAG: DUF3156 family protein [Acidimicrobiia bacterium]
MNSVARFLGKGKLPRSYRPGKLLSRIAVDLRQHELELASPNRGRFLTKGGGLPSFDVHEDVIKNFLGHITVVVFGYSMPAPEGRSGHAVLRNTGRLKRTGVEAVVKEGDAAFTEAVDRLITNKGFERALIELDFKRYELRREANVWRAETELIGASEVITAFPPKRIYVRLYPDQRSALLGSFTAMEQVLG